MNRKFLQFRLSMCGLFLLLFVSNINAQQAQMAVDNEIPFEVISAGQFSGIKHQASVVIQSAKDFEMLWHHHTSDPMVNDTTIPKVDFETETVVANFLGATIPNSCGYDIQVIDVADKKQSIDVMSLIRYPNDLIVCLVATQPYEIIKMQKINKIVTVRQRAIPAH